MYKAGAYFVECVPSKDEARGWRCIVRFSRISDVGRGGIVPKVAFVCPRLAGTSLAAEYEAVLWARKYVETNHDDLERALASR